MNIKILKTETGKHIIEINGERVGSVISPDNYRVIHSLSTLGTMQFILIPDETALRVAVRINAQLNPSTEEGEETI